MPRFRGMSEGHNTFESTVVDEVNMEGTLQEQSIKRALSGIQSRCVWSYRSIDRKPSDTKCAIFG